MPARTIDHAFTARHNKGAASDPTYAGGLSFMRRRHTKNVTGADAIAYRVLCLALAVVCGACVLAVVPDRLRHVEGLGRRSLAVYALHIPVVFVLQDAFQGAGIDQVEASLLALAVTIVVLRVLVHPFFDQAIRRTASTMAQVAVPPPLLHLAGERVADDRVRV